MPPPYLLIRGRLAPGPETKQGLERGHGLPPPSVTEDELIKINLKLIAAHAVIGSDQPNKLRRAMINLERATSPPRASLSGRLTGMRLASGRAPRVNAILHCRSRAAATNSSISENL